MYTQTEAVEKKNFVIKTLAIVTPIILIVLYINSLQNSKPISGIAILNNIAAFVMAILFYYAIILPVILVAF